MKAVIMAGGEGTRLRPLTSRAPKPMLPLMNRPMMEHVINLLRRHGFDEIVVTVAFMASSIRNYFGDGSEFGVNIVYANEDVPLGTAGSVRNASDALDERFLVISGDVLTDINLSDIWNSHIQRGAMASIGLKKVSNPLEFGIVITNPDGAIERFLEKPTWGQVFSDTVNTGIYVLEPEIFDYIEPDRPVDFSSEVFPRMLTDRRSLMGTILEGYWEDVGTLEAYLRAHQDALDGIVHLDIPGFRLAEGVWLGEGVTIDPKAVLEAPILIGDFCRVEAGAKIRAYSVLGSNVRVGPESLCERSVVLDNTYLGSNVRVRGALIGRSVDLRDGSRCEDGSVIGDQVFVGDHAVVSPSVKVFPEKTIESGAVVNSSIVWESKGVRTLFGSRGVQGLANVDIGPELGVRLAMALGTTLRKGANVVVSRDTSRSARALMRAIIAGLNASGVNVCDLEVATVPLTRFEIIQARAHAGIAVRLAADDAESVSIRFFGPDGNDLVEVDQRKIERLFGREEFRRVLADEIGDISYAPRTLDYYTSALLRDLELTDIQQRRFKVVVDYASGSAAEVMPHILGKLGVDVLALNPFAATKPMMHFERRSALRRVGDLVKSARADIGIVIDSTGELLTLVDENGNAVAPPRAALMVATLCAKRMPGLTVVAPLSFSDRLEDIVGAAGGRVVRSKIAPSAVQRTTSGLTNALGINEAGGFAFPGLISAFDAVASFVRIIELLAWVDTPLSQLVSDVPGVEVAHDVIPTAWENKGAVMRALVEDRGHDAVQLIDGVHRRSSEGWTLVLPDPDQPLTHVWAEAALCAAVSSTELAEATSRTIRQISIRSS